ncbi:MAG: GNAT family N-acetyltransferase [Bacteriovoracaceae bacterium]
MTSSHKVTLKEFDLSLRSEAELIVSIVLKYYPNSAYPPTVEKIMKGDVRYYKAFFEGEMVGMSGYFNKTPTLAETVKTIVLEQFRGKKLGEAISWAIEEECKKNGIKKVSSTIYTSNVAMIAIKLKQGYTIEGFHPEHEAPGFDEYSLGKILR